MKKLMTWIALPALALGVSCKKDSKAKPAVVGSPIAGAAGAAGSPQVTMKGSIPPEVLAKMNAAADGSVRVQEHTFLLVSTIGANRSDDGVSIQFEHVKDLCGAVNEHESALIGLLRDIDARMAEARSAQERRLLADADGSVSALLPAVQNIKSTLGARCTPPTNPQ